MRFAAGVERGAEGRDPLGHPRAPDPLREGDAFTLSLSGSAKAIDAALDQC